MWKFWKVFEKEWRKSMTLCEKMEVANQNLKMGVVFCENVDIDELEAIPSIAEMEVGQIQQWAIAMGNLVSKLAEKGEME